MSGFNRGLLEEKLRVLSSSQHSIQTLSLWMIHHRSHAGAAIEIWLRELLAASPPRKLSLVYLANDAVLQSRKSGTGTLLHALLPFSLAVGGVSALPAARIPRPTRHHPRHHQPKTPELLRAPVPRADRHPITTARPPCVCVCSARKAMPLTLHSRTLRPPPTHPPRVLTEIRDAFADNLEEALTHVHRYCVLGPCPHP